MWPQESGTAVLNALSSLPSRKRKDVVDTVQDERAIKRLSIESPSITSLPTVQPHCLEVIMSPPEEGAMSYASAPIDMKHSQLVEYMEAATVIAPPPQQYGGAFWLQDRAQSDLAPSHRFIVTMGHYF